LSRLCEICTVPFDPASSDLGNLFRDPDMFDSADDWRDEDFKILRASENKICVASHKTVEGYLFKKYVNAGKRESSQDQLNNYTTRIDGARRLRRFIDEQHLQHVVVPRKWLRTLPRRFDAHILVVDRLDIQDDEASERQYGHINEAVLRELCVVLHAFRGLDSTAKNMPFTRDGKIAFIDTEHWNRHSKARSVKRKFLKHVGEHLSSGSRSIAQEMWEKLDGSGALDFDDEEDTSSSSSSSSSS
jgi:hypothetical protein